MRLAITDASLTSERALSELGTGSQERTLLDCTLSYSSDRRESVRYEESGFLETSRVDKVGSTERRAPFESRLEGGGKARPIVVIAPEVFIGWEDYELLGAQEFLREKCGGL